METTDLISELAAAFTQRPNKLTATDIANLKLLLSIPVPDDRLYRIKHLAKNILERIKLEHPYDYLIKQMVIALTTAIQPTQVKAQFADARVPYAKVFSDGNNVR